MFEPTQARHWLAVQWALWMCEERLGLLYGRGFRRWTTLKGGQVALCVGEAWGTHWQRGPLRLLPWGCWIEEDDQALVYDAQRDHFYVAERWCRHRSHAMVACRHPQPWSFFERAALQGLALDPCWELVQRLQATGYVHPEAAMAWFMSIGSQGLALERAKGGR